MKNKEKMLNLKLYAVLAVVFIAAFLIISTVMTFRAKYMAFHPDELARSFAETIVSNGDGYNAYKNTLVSKNMKYGDFIRENFITPAVKRDAATGEKDYSDDSFKGERTLNDDGTLSGQLTAEMYPVYKELIEMYGWDNYSAVFSEYIEKLIEVREKIFSDKFFNDEVFFTAFEANVAQYGKMLTGSEETYDENTGVKLSDKITGLYEEMFGEDYSFTFSTENERRIELSQYKSGVDKKSLELYGINEDDISDVISYTVTVSVNGEKTVTSADIILVKIGSSWYVDNTVTDTSALYPFNFAD